MTSRSPLLMQGGLHRVPTPLLAAVVQWTLYELADLGAATLACSRVPFGDVPRAQELADVAVAGQNLRLL